MAKKEKDFFRSEKKMRKMRQIKERKNKEKEI